MRNYLHQNSDPQYHVHSIKHRVSPLMEPFLIAEGEEDLELKYGKLQAKLSETIPLIPEHKDLIHKKNRSDLLLNSNSDTRNTSKNAGMYQTMRVEQAKARSNAASPFLEKIPNKKYRGADIDSVVEKLNNLRGLSPMRNPEHEISNRQKSMT